MTWIMGSSSNLQLVSRSWERRLSPSLQIVPATCPSFAVAAREL